MTASDPSTPPTEARGGRRAAACGGGRFGVGGFGRSSGIDGVHARVILAAWPESLWHLPKVPAGAMADKTSYTLMDSDASAATLPGLGSEPSGGKEKPGRYDVWNGGKVSVRVVLGVNFVGGRGGRRVPRPGDRRGGEAELRRRDDHLPLHHQTCSTQITNTQDICENRAAGPNHLPFSPLKATDSANAMSVFSNLQRRSLGTEIMGEQLEVGKADQGTLG